MSQVRKIILNKRDQEVLIFLFKNKILTLEQVHKYFFTKSSKITANIRMNKLFSAGYVDKKSIFFINKNQTYFLITPLGIESIQDQLSGEVLFKGYKSDSLEHDLHLSDISKVFEGFSSVSKIYYESELQSYNSASIDDQLHPFFLLKSDRVLEVSGPKGSTLVALEYERSVKRSHRLMSKLRDYYLNEDVPAVFYICENKHIIRELMKADLKACDGIKSKIYFCELKDVKKINQKIIFTNQLGHKMTFK